MRTQSSRLKSGRTRNAPLAALLLVAATLSQAYADQLAVVKGTRLRFHLTQAISSNQSKTGETFEFVLIDPITVDGHDIAPSGAVGSGTVFLAGHAGSQGHEGDLTLRLDSIPTLDGQYIAFDDQRLRINGRNRKIASAVLGFVPYAGFASFLIRGSDIRIDPETPIETVLLRPAVVGARLTMPQAAATPQPAATPQASATSRASPMPSAPG